mmetsp:Transcript_10355/g.18259  ORF Transcript_10355/g.18259 Transcript_10355/m.18259 type:complete len:195 (+) Transcript_10355:356-940(+)
MRETLVNPSSRSAVLKPNLWPVSQSRLQPAMEAFSAEMLTLGHTVMDSVACGLDQEFGITLRRELFEDPFWVMRAIHYPPQSEPSQGCGEHTDYGLLTMIAQDPVPGCLFIRHKGKLVCVDPVPGTLVINIGDCLEFWTDGLLKATPHMVVSPQHKSRVSVPFFFEPNFDAVIAPGGVTYGQHLENKCGANFLF